MREAQSTELNTSPSQEKEKTRDSTGFERVSALSGGVSVLEVQRSPKAANSPVDGGFRTRFRHERRMLGSP